MARRIVVAGGGLAGLRACERLIAAGWDDEIVMFGAEPHPPYTRPPLTKEALRTGADLATVELRRRPSFARVDLRVGTPVAGADLDGRRVLLEDGTEVGYHGLVVATGLRPRRLPLAAPVDLRHVVRTLDDATALHAHLRPGARVVVLGAGFIGCEVAAVAADLGCRVTVVDPLELPLLGQLGRLAGTVVAGWLADAGVELRTGTAVARLTDTGPTRTLDLHDGGTLTADVVVEAVGSVPATEWLDGNGLDLSDGVLCDAALRPVRDGGPLPGVVAAGDVARYPLPGFGPRARRVEHWTSAADTAAHAVRSLLADPAGEPGPGPDGLTALPSFWSDQGGHRVQAFGLPAAGMADQRLLEGTTQDGLVVGYHDPDGTLVGVAALDLPARAMHYRGLVEAAHSRVAAGSR